MKVKEELKRYAQLLRVIQSTERQIETMSERVQSPKISNISNSAV